MVQPWELEIKGHNSQSMSSRDNSNCLPPPLRACGAPQGVLGSLAPTSVSAHIISGPSPGKKADSQAPPNQTLLGQGPGFAFGQIPHVVFLCTKVEKPCCPRSCPHVKGGGMNEGRQKQNEHQSGTGPAPSPSGSVFLSRITALQGL